ncbi:dephospho-CoA kinase [Propionibacterium sp. oral taxon 192 str. F0372]|uniref:dephospho-CoA kinase n=1 Tax=Propionibacterium sp. oral taxon 192 TaxID=671222 RepID=UPI0003537CC8|nr:dephospho-CoA kinase [Propionibacterium sp. oral taxon 192]EPH02637.1 dephospho-CoA kinase [Propionibacterium sp. oral taxon 192 str. F0372]
MVAALSVALTGGIASGKSTVADLFADRGAVIIDSDLLAREVVEPGTEGLAEIIDRFGAGVLDGDGRLNRAGLGEIIFADETARQDLNQIIHPRVRARRTELIAAAPDDAVSISIIPLLVETGVRDRFAGIILVDLPVAEQLRRLMARNHMTADQAQARIRGQATRAERLAVADWVIDNSGTPGNLPHQVDRVWTQLLWEKVSRS